MKLLKKILSFLPVLAIITVILLLVFYKSYMPEHKEKPKPVTPQTNDADNRPQLVETVITSKKDGKIYWDLSAKKIALEQSTKKGAADEVSCRFYDNKGKVYITFKSPYADIDMNTQSVDFTSMSHGTLLESGDKIDVAHLVWDGINKKLMGYDGVKIYRNDYTLTSEEMIGDPETRNVELIKNVEGIWMGSQE